LESASRDVSVEEGLLGPRSVRARIPDGVASAQTNPLRDRAVLLLGLGKLLLGAERLEGLHRQESVHVSLLYLFVNKKRR